MCERDIVIKSSGVGYIALSVSEKGKTFMVKSLAAEDILFAGTELEMVVEGFERAGMAVSHE